MSATSLLDLKSLTAEHVAKIFSLTDRLSTEKPVDRSFFRNRQGLVAALIFFEPSTRTRMSFEMACFREGLNVSLLDAGSGSSLEKGETYEDTVLNIAAMKPNLLVIRSGDDLDFEAITRRVQIPILNAGWGRRGHPTQALLDAYAIHKARGALDKQKVLLIGDVRHSRVASSHLELAKVLGYEVAFCGPKDFLPENPTVKTFDRLEEGLQWATAAMALRVQLERHQTQSNMDEYHREWGLNSQSLTHLNPHGLILHPGPINWGVEMAHEVMSDRRCVILDQVTGGAFLRQALIRQIFEEAT